jgi:hypothetical protein
VYGKFAGDERYSICAVTSEDHGVTWRFQAIVARADVAPDAREGPNEAALARLPSGRLLCVFRVAGRQPFWMTTSADEGASWAAPSPMSGVWSVMPHLVALPSGLVLLSGGREGLFLWVAADGEGREWRRTDLAAHHNACVPESMRFAAGYVGGQATVSPAPSTSYTGLLPIGPDEVLVAYDRLANGWKGAPGPYGEHDMVFCARVRVQRTGP